MDNINLHRRHLVGAGAFTLAAAQLGIGRATAQPTAAGQAQTGRSFGPLKQVEAGVLSIGYASGVNPKHAALFFFFFWSDAK